MLISSSHHRIYADYHQFYLEDEGGPHRTDTLWDKDTAERMLAVGEGLLGVGTARYETVPVRIEFHDGEPETDAGVCSRINECSLRTDSGRLVLSGCTEYLPEAARIEAEPGIYRVRVLYIGLETVVDDWEGEDRYVLQLWKDTRLRDVRVLKDRTGV